ncbi:uncharacterized protein BO66DRAFT_393012 [Aspergillus aculeatinus CBS 121060]|uniref:Uncharacterized protein n=1 Tax=Aspergillus aculeatinus CBS 121060 TaxID=1448322 RepID=A0ACD1H5A4_9EURO|nr:hypothetical protein BO66DRAFT_393012 [Aspergillus aculeatinus CBS 121060]RAH68683.1 hypothetical protein BO66DRAFT_393012 [Aspergillus aculeatinus CBS 121060]
MATEVSWLCCLFTRLDNLGAGFGTRRPLYIYGGLPMWHAPACFVLDETDTDNCTDTGMNQARITTNTQSPNLTTLTQSHHTTQHHAHNHSKSGSPPPPLLQESHITDVVWKRTNPKDKTPHRAPPIQILTSPIRPKVSQQR